MTGELVPVRVLPGAMSVAVIVQVPEVKRYVSPGKVMVPFTSAASEGSAAAVSVLVRCTVSVTDGMMCQVLSQALTVTSNGTPETCSSGVPILPVVVFGALVSPGSRTCNCEATRLIKRK